MIKINKKIEYALMALKYMSQRCANAKGEEQTLELTSAREICDKFHTPFDTTAKVLQLMNNQGILISTKGIKGGYSLAVPLSHVTFGQLAEIIEGKNKTGSFCQSAKGRCDLYENCNIVTPIDLLSKKVNEYLSSLSLEELLLNEHANNLVSMVDSKNIKSEDKITELP
ncbi:MAG: transcriptional regulator [Halobacteriovoraceae bacterium]|nr:transcriptional regulator [Halobacteriovoraceae bacterium]|tara:strand:+ start:110578 stop:111084 length:507 start_codon:yes stop_codon:yes gene_type:complete